LLGITEEDMGEAMQHAGLVMLKSYNYFGDVSQTAAAYAASGYGLCSNPQDVDICEEEEAQMAVNSVLGISYTKITLSVSYGPRLAAHLGRVSKRVVSYDLGSDCLQTGHDTLMYWKNVSSAIFGVIEATPRLTSLLLFGEEATSKEFREVVRDTLFSLRHTDITSHSSFRDIEPLGLAARGAAEFAKRFQEMPWGCREPAGCNEGSEINSLSQNDL
jgi:hypothetical protein